MTDAEKRRRELLEQTRKAYSDKYNPPAVHPRYRSTYQSLYKSEEEEYEEGKGSFGIRTVIAVLIFCLFVVASQANELDTQQVSGMIEEEFEGFVDLPIFD